MQMSYYPPRTASGSATVQKFFSLISSSMGILLLMLLTAHTAETYALNWSPTETAKRCFSYPEQMWVPNSKEMAQMLLSAAFFGSDALYFDDGEENTGSDIASEVLPSEISSEESPDKPLDSSMQSPFTQDNIYYFDRTLLGDGESALIPYDLSGSPKSGEVLLSNTTKYQIDTVEYLHRDYPIQIPYGEVSMSDPLVLIIHTHGTESYAPEGAISVSSGYVARDSDTSRNMIAVGKVMSDLLNDAGIPTLHCEIMHDLESYNRSYDLAADTIQKYLAQYPSIKYVFDVHRDAIVRENGDFIRPLTLINGECSAQIMLLVGTNEKGADHPDWETNMTVAAKLQNRLTSTYDRFARPINIRGASFNQQFNPGSILIEIGSAANTLNEAKTAAKYLTYSIIDMLKENQ